MNLKDIRRFSDLEQKKCRLSESVKDIRMYQELDGSHPAADEYTDSISLYESLIAGAIREQLDIKLVICQVEDDDDRMILDLYKDGMTIEAIAEEMGYSSRTISRRLRRIEKELLDGCLVNVI